MMFDNGSIVSDAGSSWLMNGSWWLMRGSMAGWAWTEHPPGNKHQHVGVFPHHGSPQRSQCGIMEGNSPQFRKHPHCADGCLLSPPIQTLLRSSVVIRQYRQSSNVATISLLHVLPRSSWHLAEHLDFRGHPKGQALSRVLVSHHSTWFSAAARWIFLSKSSQVTWPLRTTWCSGLVLMLWRFEESIMKIPHHYHHPHHHLSFILIIIHRSHSSYPHFLHYWSYLGAHCPTPAVMSVVSELYNRHQLSSTVI